MIELSRGTIECLRFIYNHPDHSVSNEAVDMQFGSDMAEYYTKKLWEAHFIDDDRPLCSSLDNYPSGRPFMYFVTPEGLDYLNELDPIKASVSSPAVSAAQITVDSFGYSHIVQISPGFIEQYNQAVQIEAIGLPDAAGMIYRKALEFLIKDYLIKSYPEKEGKIVTKSLANCIKEFITDCDELCTAASRAAFLGNDFAHYARNHNQYDIQDLKNVIYLAQCWIVGKNNSSNTPPKDPR